MRVPAGCLEPAIAASFLARHPGASLGLLAAAVSVAWVGYRLVGATAPVPTPVSLTSRTTERVSVESLRVNGIEVLPMGWTAGSGPASPTAQARSLDLPVGRPVDLQARLSAPQAGAASCRVEQRPYGTCILQVNFDAAMDMRCEFECQGAATKP